MPDGLPDQQADPDEGHRQSELDPIGVDLLIFVESFGGGEHVAVHAGDMPVRDDRVDNAEEHQRDVEDQEGGGNAQGMERRRHEDGGRAEQDGDVGLEAQAAGGHVAGLAEDALVDDLLAVELVFELLQLLLHLEEGGIGVFHVTAFF